MTAPTLPCAHIARTNAHTDSGLSQYGAACSGALDLRFRSIPAASILVRHIGEGTANAVWVHAHPGFKSPSLRRSPGPLSRHLGRGPWSWARYGPAKAPTSSTTRHSVEIELVALDVLHHEARLVVVIGGQ
jgi:hypothetical protein